ncbi:hydroxysteroid dehydrogenase-like protein 2 [Thalassophryne amazonica]|uniref:hydroxysteroid dehydrogenase-like protein 2 n=1 Tax=Thalassophryne amazonica TaxID=390379 RepID=UPI001471EDBC|nr:hydroxysteroid dehydrogenase-like protein 2 [Thalassophryne amazonica]
MLPNTGKLAGCTLFITGASRGIGKAIALKAARDGANIVIAAKTTDPHPKLPGTIYTAAKEVEAAGGKALACVVDIRNEQQVGEAVQKAVDMFGGIDILVNNASAISLTGTLGTPMKKVDLMLGINLRGTYLTSKLCIPHLLKSRNPHILNLSPPLNLNPVWFRNHTAYTMAKYGMSMCVLGMAEEFKGHIAVNALWPKTAIQTAAMDMLGGDGVSKQCRKPEIVADAAYTILSQPTEFTGHFLVDEDVLKDHGVHDMEPYAVQPGHPLLPDFFLDESPETLVQQMEQHGATSAFKPPSHDTSRGPIESTFDVIRGVISADVVKSTQGVYQFDLSGEHEGVWFLDLKSGSGSAGQGEPPAKADVVMSMDSADFTNMFAGNLKPTMAFMSGKLQIKGDMMLAMKLEKLMNRMNKAKL